MTKKAYSYIRLSTPEQLKGDSLRRQLEASRNMLWSIIWCWMNPWVIWVSVHSRDRTPPKVHSSVSWGWSMLGRLSKCLECGTTFRHQMGTLKCDNNYLPAGCGCDKKWRYHDVENAALLVLKDEIKGFEALGGHTDSRQALETNLQVLQGKLTASEKQVGRFAELFMNNSG